MLWSTAWLNTLPASMSSGAAAMMPRGGGVQSVEALFLLLLLFVALFAGLARRLRVPYPILLARVSCTESGQNGGKRMLHTEVWFMDTKSICPTVGEINALPRKVKRYIHDLETRTNQNGQALTVKQLREERDRLQQRVEDLEARIALQEREYLEAPIETD